ncbi:hypothetical protein GCK32_021498 [Trichostrongylus colubriformis]|uniref:Uncharacterized protein n=1 Tax=Trichostrongylus colubriformis TaxID=6319 RepID=A0AAN8EYK2_TRICO
MIELDELDDLDGVISEDADSDEEAMGEKCITLLSSLLPSGSSFPYSAQSQSVPTDVEEKSSTTRQLTILSTAAEVINDYGESIRASESHDEDDDDVLPPPEGQYSEQPEELQEEQGNQEVRVFSF